MSKQIIQGSFADEMKTRYLTYAMSTIMGRALPDVRDGLKPVHRRLLYVMRLLKLDPEKGYKKCARVVGDVIGKYHPHGDQAVYDAMVRLAQDFAVRYPMVDGQGNFGSVDGDNPAAMRYTEAKMTKVAQWMMRDIEQGTVDFRANYDETESEPIVFPACFPNLLANGSTGIAVGMSTSIPPHNVGEICNALKKLLKNPEISNAQLHKSVKGPDLPTGGIIAETPEAIAQCYETGRGGIRVRARWEKEDLPRGQYQIVVTEIPYQVQKSRLIEKIADLINNKKLLWLADVRDESAEDIRIVLEPKSRTIDPAALMETLFKATDLENRLNVIMHAINANGEPELMTLKRICEEFTAHRKVVLIRKTEWRLDKIAARLHVLAAYKVVYLNLDEVIEIIKENDKPSPILMERFGIDEIQAEAILNMRLRRLRKLDEMEIRKEFDDLEVEQTGLQKLLGSDDLQTEALLTEVDDIKKEFGDKRRTDIEGAPSAVVIPLEAQVEKEPITVLISQHGWIKTVKGHMEPDQEAKFKDGDDEGFRILTQSVADICLLSSSGKAFTLNVAKLPSGRGFGEPVRLMIELGDDKIIHLFEATEKGRLLLATKGGYGFVIEGNALTSQTKNGKQVMNLTKNDSPRFCLPVPEWADTVAAYAGTNRLLVFPLDEIPTMNRGKGVKLMAVKESELEHLCVFAKDIGLGLSGGVTSTKERIQTDLDPWQGKRAQVGKLPPHGFQKNISLFTPEPEKTAEKKPENNEKTEEERYEELVKAVTTPAPTPDDDDDDEPDLFRLLDKD